MNRISKLSFSMIFLFLALFLSYNSAKAQSQDFELLWSYNISADAGQGQAGSETDGQYLYTTFWNSGNFAKFDLQGNWIETFQVTGAEGIRDLAYDGTYFYGSNGTAGTGISQMDFSTNSLIDVIPATPAVRHIAYDEDNDAFWCGDWGTDFTRINRSGTIEATILASTHGVASIYGSAYDNVSDGGPYLWLHSQGFSTSSSAVIQVNIASGTQTGVWIDAQADAGADIDSPSAGGLYNSTEVEPGFFVIGGLIQGAPNKFFAYAIADAPSGGPNLVYPPHKANSISTGPIFEWEEAEDAETYQIQVSQQADFANTIIDEIGLTDLSYETPEGLLNETTLYYWHVRGFDENSEPGPWSSRWRFITGGQLEAPVLIYPYDGSTNVVSNVEIAWGPVLGADWFQVQVATDPTFGELVVDNDYVTGLNYALTGLQFATDFWWRVMAHNDENSSDWSDVWQFTTGAFVTIGDGSAMNTTTSWPAPYGNYWWGAKHQMLIRADEMYDAGALPGAITSLAFCIGTLNNTTPLQNFTLRMKSTEQDVLNAVWDTDEFITVYQNPGYVPYLGWNNHEFIEPFIWDGASNILIDVCFNNPSYSQNQSTYYTTLTYNCVRYYYADNATVCTAPGSPTVVANRPNVMFSIDASGLFPPQNIYPTNGELGVSQTPLFDWTDVNDAISYGIIVATDPGFENIIIYEEGLDESQYQIQDGADLAPSTMHYWRANASDGYNTSPWSQRWSFATGGPLPPPVLISPPNYSSGIPSTVPFEWIFGVAVETYQLQVATDADFNSIVYDQILTVSEVVVGLAMNSSYYWRVKAYNPSSESDWSEVWQFTTGSFFTVGEGTAYNTYTGYPAPFGNYYYGAKHQMLILADEIYDAGGMPGAFTSLSFNIFELQTGRLYNNFQIRMKSTDQTVLDATWDVDDFTDVYYNPSLPTNDLGWFTIMFDEPFVWDGGSNILVDVCFNNSSVGYNHSTYYTVTPFNSVRFYRAYNATVCTAFGTATLSTLRPNMMFSVDASGIIPPQNIYPTNGELGVSQTPLFDWTDVDVAISYGIIVATDPGFENIVIYEEGLDESQYQVPDGGDLAPSTMHYWRANASDGYDTSPWSARWSFATGGPLPPPILVNPPNYSAGIPSTIPFEWEFGVAVETYQLQIATDAEFNNIVYDQMLTYIGVVVGLQMNTDYWWRVKAFNPSSESDWSEVWEFSTGSFFEIGQSTTNSTSYPNPYGNTYWGVKNQMLIHAEEIYNAGGIPGAITSLSFNVATVNNTNPHNNFTIKIKPTMQTTLDATWDFDDFTTCYVHPAYVCVQGWNTHLFDEPFIWDGSSNIIVDVCFQNSDWQGSQTIFYTAASFQASRYYYGDNATVCTAPAACYNSNNRPNMMFSLDASGITPPQNIYPTNGELGVSQTPLFDWSDVEGAISYGIIVATDPNFENIIIFEEGLDESQYQVPEGGDLAPSTMHYWRANASDGYETSYWSMRWSFATGGPLPPPVLISPPNYSAGIPSTVQFEWEFGVAVETYQLQVATDAEFNNVVYDQILTVSEITVGLEMNSGYWWRVKAFNPSSESDWSEAWEFTTGSFFEIGQATTSTSSYPVPYGNLYWGAKHQLLIRADEIYEAGGIPGAFTSLSFNVQTVNNTNPLNNFTIKMKTTDQTVLDATWDFDDFTTCYVSPSYLCVLGWNTHLFEEPFIWDGASNIIIDICFQNSDWNGNQTMFYTATSYNSVRYSYGDNTTVCTNPTTCYNSTYRSNMMFSIDASGIFPPLNVYPTNGELGVSQTPLFDWEDVDVAISYGIIVATDPRFENVVIFEEGLDESQYQVSEDAELSPSTMHYWKANATDGESTSPWSMRWSFATGGDLPAPILVSPPNNAAGIPSTVPFEWIFGIAVETYQLQIAIDAEFNQIVFDEMLTVSEITVGLSMNAGYYWRVKAFNPSSESEWSEIWHFTTGSFFTIGEGTTYNDYINYPAPFGNWYYGAKHQMLILADEIYDAGGLPGAFTSLSFNIFELQTGRLYNNFQIRMKPTDQTVLNATWDVDDFTDVYYNPSLPTNDLGWFTHMFQEPFIWDGTSNILVDVCFNNSSVGYNHSTYWTQTPFNSVRYYRADNATVCSAPGTPTLSNMRPNIMFSVDASGIVPPQHIYPTNGELGVSQTVTFDWSDVEVAISYGLIVATDPDFENIVIFEEGLDESQYEVPEANELAPSTMHYWRINASDGYDTSPWSARWSFATGGPLPPPTLIFPLNMMTGIPATVPFEWLFGVAVETYQLQVAVDEEFSNVVYDQILTVSQITVGLGMNSSYYWRVKAFNPSSESDWSEVWHFTTGSFFTVGEGTQFAGNTTYPAPYGNWYGGCKHQILIRADELYDAGAVPGVLTSLSFDVGELYGTPLQGFYIGLKHTTENVISTVWDMTDWNIVYGPTTYQPVEGWNLHVFDDGFEWDGASNILVETCFNNMAYTRSECTRYTVTPYNSVRWFNSDQNATVCTNPTSAGVSPNRPNMMFGLDASGLLPPQNYQPADGALYQPLDLVFEWGEVEGAISYGLIVSTDPNFTFLVIEETGLQETQYEVPEGTLESFQQYYWRANASDGEATSPWSQRWNFITGGELRAPYLTQPENGASGIPATVQFKWESIFGVGSYQLQAAIDLAFGNIVLDQTVNTNEFTFGLDMNASYYWRVRAITPEAEGPWSEAWQFSTGSFFTVGTGTGFNGPYEYPAPYGNYWWGAKHQILVRADEMLAAGAEEGELTSISFNVQGLNNLNVPLNGFTIKMKQTTESTLTATWDEQGLTTVFPATALPVTLGWNTHMFSTPFPWDGVSNILIDICFNNSSYTQNAATYYTTTSYNSVREYHADNSTVCSTPSTPTLWTNRPNIMFSGGPTEPPLDPPYLISPDDGITNIPITNQEFSWSSVEDAASYRIQLSRNTAFTNIVANEVVEGTSFTLETTLNTETQYWWRAQAISESGRAGYWSSVWSFTTRPHLPEIIIDVTTNTGNDAIIIVPADIAPMIGSRQIADGDAIALFYQLPTGQWRCAGYGVWDGQNIGITVWGDDDRTPEKDGYSVGEEYSFRVWDSQTDIIWPATATFSMGPSSYTVNGFSIVESLVVHVTEMFDLTVASGWNIISSCIDPEDPDIENMFAPIATNIQVMRDGAGQTYNPAYNINDIGEWDIYQAYFLNMLEQDMLTIAGNTIVPEATPIPLIAGWNLSPYLRNNPMNAAVALASITDNLVLVKNYEGLIYAPVWGLNTIGNMQPGQGFQMNVAQASELTYPANYAGKASAGEYITPLPKHLVPSMTRTGNSATLLVKLDAENGTEVGVYGANGELLGSGYVQDGTVGINIWGDNHATELIDGAAYGELLTAKLYNPTTDSYKDLLLSSIVDISKGLELDAIAYSENAIYSARGTVISEDTYVIRNTPNPAANSTTFEFSLANDGNAEIVVYTLRGDEVARIRLDGYSAGMHTVVFNTDDLANGSYNVVLRSGTNNVSTIMVIVK